MRLKMSIFVWITFSTPPRRVDDFLLTIGSSNSVIAVTRRRPDEIIVPFDNLDSNISEIFLRLLSLPICVMIE